MSIVLTPPNLKFTVVAEPSEKHVSFKIFDIVYYRSIDNVPMYEDKNVDCDSTPDLEDANVFAHGTVKWDGCSKWHFDEQDRNMVRGCSREDLQRLGEVLTFCWDQTRELCNKFNGD